MNIIKRPRRGYTVCETLFPNIPYSYQGLYIQGFLFFVFFYFVNFGNFLVLVGSYLALLGALLASPASDLTPSTRGNPDPTWPKHIFDPKNN